MARRATLTLIATPAQMKSKRAKKAKRKAKKNRAASTITRAVRRRAKMNKSKNKSKEQKRIAACVKRCHAGPRRRSGGGSSSSGVTMTDAQFKKAMNQAAKRQNARLDDIIARYSKAKPVSRKHASAPTRRRKTKPQALPNPSKTQAARNRAQRIAYLRKKRGGRSPYFRKRKPSTRRRRTTTTTTTKRRKPRASGSRSHTRNWPKKLQQKHKIGNQSYQVWVKKSGQKFIKRTINGKRKVVNI
jgi:hypothetical protein